MLVNWPRVHKVIVVVLCFWLVAGSKDVMNMSEGQNVFLFNLCFV